MISSSNFFKKTFFGTSQEIEPVKEQVKILGPWIKPKKQHQTIQPQSSKQQPYQFINKHQLKQLKTRNSRKQVHLPIIASKMFEIGPLKSINTDRYLVHSRKDMVSQKVSKQKTFRSLDLREIDEKKLGKSFNLNFPEVQNDASIRHLSKNRGGVFKITGIPTNILYP